VVDAAPHIQVRLDWADEELTACRADSERAWLAAGAAAANMQGGGLRNEAAVGSESQLGTGIPTVLVVGTVLAAGGAAAAGTQGSRLYPPGAETTGSGELDGVDTQGLQSGAKGFKRISEKGPVTAADGGAWSGAEKAGLASEVERLKGDCEILRAEGEGLRRRASRMVEMEELLAVQKERDVLSGEVEQLKELVADMISRMDLEWVEIELETCWTCREKLAAARRAMEGMVAGSEHRSLLDDCEAGALQAEGEALRRQVSGMVERVELLAAQREAEALSGKVERLKEHC
jgi:polyhydroxyalkanoate synthesis regulator phasin